MDAWYAFWESVNVVQLAAWVLGILAVIGFFVKGWPKIRAFVQLVDALSVLPKFMTDTTATLQAQNVKIEEIHHEVNYNNGSSVKDAVARVEAGVAGLYQRVDQADAADLALRDELERTHPKNPPAPRKARKPKETP